MDQAKEPHDHYVYNYVTFYVTTLKFFRDAVTFAESLLNEGVKAVQEDSALGSLIEERDKRDLPVFVAVRELEKTREWLDEKLSNLSEEEVRFDDTEVDISHRRVRLIKSAAMLFIRHLKIRRNEVSARPNLIQQVLQSIDRKITETEELIQKGVFQNASTIPFLADELLLPSECQDDPDVPAETRNLTRVQRPRPVVLETIEVMDEALRHRCLDLLLQFREDGDSSRLDTVVREATAILEHRLRRRSQAELDCVGLKLAAFAFGKPHPRLRLSDIEQEQEGAHQIFRGVFGFIRNHVGHHLVENLTPQRTLQIVGMVDYLLYLVDEAKVEPVAEA